MILRCEKCQTMYMFTEAQLKNQNYKFICKKCGQENTVALPADADVKDHDKEQGLPNEQEQPGSLDKQGADFDSVIDSAIDNAIDQGADNTADTERVQEPAVPESTAPAGTAPESTKSEEGKTDLEDIFASLEEKPQDKEKKPADVHVGETIPGIDFMDTGKADAAAAKPAEKAPASEDLNEEINKEGEVIEGFEEFTMDDIKEEGTTAQEQGGGAKQGVAADNSWLESTSLEGPTAGRTGDKAEEGVLPDETVPMEEESIPELADTKPARTESVPAASEEESSLLDEQSVAVPESIPVTQDTAARQKAVSEKKHLSKLLLASVSGIVAVLAALIGVYYYLVEYTPAHPDFKKLTFMSYSVIPASAKAKSRAEQLLHEADKQYLTGTISGYEGSLNLYEEAVAADHHLLGAYVGIAKDYAVLKDRNNLHDQLKNSAQFLARLKEILKDDARYNLAEAMIDMANDDYAHASKEIDTALQKSPALPEALYYRGYIDFKQGESMTQAAALLTQAASLEPDMVKAKLLLARIYQRQHDPARAVDILDAILASYPYNVSAVTLKADIQSGSVTGTTQAIADLNAVLNKAGNQIDAYDKANISYAIGKLQMKRGDYPAAIAAFKISLQNNRSAKASIALGDAYLESGNLSEAENQYKAAIATDRTTVEGNLKLARAYYLDKKYVLAVSSYNECLKLEKNNPDVLYGMALAREGNGELDTALQTIETAVRQSPDNPVFMTLDGRLLRKKKDYKSAAAVLSGAVAKFPSYAPLHTEYAVVLGKEGNYGDAIRQLNTAMSISPVSAENNAYMADMLGKESKYAQAEKYALKALSIDNTLPYAYEVLGDIYFGEHRPGDSIKAYNSSIVLKPYEARVFYKLAQVYIAGGVFTSAVSSLESAIKINPTDALYHYALGNVYRDMGNIQFAINEYTKAVSIDGTMADAYYQRGLLNIAGKNDLAAVNDLKNAMKYAPDNPDYMLALSNYYYNNKETYSAIDYLEMALKRAPENPEIHYRLGVAYNYIGKTDDAKKEFLAALAIAPRYSEAMVGLGNISYQNGNIGKAEQYYEKAIRISPDEGDAHYSLGTVYESNGMYEKALTEYKYAAKFSKNPAAAYFKEGIMLSNLNEPEQAKTALLKAISLGLSSDMETMAKNKLRNLM